MKRRLPNGSNGLSLVLAENAQSAIRRDGDGVPTAIRILSPGDHDLTIDGAPYRLAIEPADIHAMAEWHATKGTAIPVDCEHLLQWLADEAGVEEAELVRTNPLLGERAAAGLVRLVEEDGALWAHVERWSARARELLQGVGDALYGYFSPVIRGFTDGNMRVTSIALTNLPALNRQELLAASSEARNHRLPIAQPVRNPNRGGRPMDPIRKLAELLGIDAVSLTDEATAIPQVVAAAIAEIEQRRKAAADFLAAVGEPLGLASEATLENAAGAILSRIEKGRSDATALGELTARVQDLEGKERDRFLADLQAAGKLTEAMLPWAKRQNLAALRDWATTAPVIVQAKRIVDGNTLAADDAAGRLTEADRAVAQACRVDPKRVAEVCGLKA